jgi:hypothetical protein
MTKISVIALFYNEKESVKELLDLQIWRSVL